MEGTKKYAEYQEREEAHASQSGPERSEPRQAVSDPHRNQARARCRERALTSKYWAIVEAGTVAFCTIRDKIEARTDDIEGSCDLVSRALCNLEETTAISWSPFAIALGEIEDDAC